MGRPASKRHLACTVPAQTVTSHTFAIHATTPLSCFVQADCRPEGRESYLLMELKMLMTERIAKSYSRTLQEQRATRVAYEHVQIRSPVPFDFSAQMDRVVLSPGSFLLFQVIK